MLAGNTLRSSRQDQLTELAVVGACAWRSFFRTGWRVRRSWRHHAISGAHAVASRTGRAVVCLLLAVAALVVHASSTLSVLWHTMLRWHGTARTTSHVQTAHGVAHLAGLDVAQGLLEVVDVAGGLADLRVDTRADGRVVGGLRHLAGGVDDGIFAVDFADELLHGGLVVVAHGGGRGARGGAGGGRRTSCLGGAGGVVFAVGWPGSRWCCCLGGGGESRSTPNAERAACVGPAITTAVAFSEGRRRWVGCGREEEEAGVSARRVARGRWK